MDEKELQNDTGENIKTIHTYSSDMADAVRMNEVSVIKVALAEQKKHEQEALYKQAEGTKTSKVFLFIGGIIIIALAVGGIYYLQKKKESENVTEQITKNIEAVISYDDQVFINMDNAINATDVAFSLKTEIDKGSSEGKIKVLFLTRATGDKPELLPLENFLSLIKSTAPSSLIRSFADQYMIGTYQPVGDTTQHLFLVFQTKDYNQSYAGMLGWEKTLLDDMFELFHIDVSGNRNNLLEKPWKDIILNNKDARVLLDARDNELLYYIFADKDNIIITDNKDTIKEVTARLLIKNIKPL